MPKEYPDPQSWNFVSNVNSLVLGVQTIGTMGKLDARHLTLAQKRGTQMGGGECVWLTHMCVTLNYGCCVVAGNNGVKLPWWHNSKVNSYLGSNSGRWCNPQTPNMYTHTRSMHNLSSGWNYYLVGWDPTKIQEPWGHWWHGMWYWLVHLWEAIGLCGNISWHETNKLLRWYKVNANHQWEGIWQSGVRPSFHKPKKNPIVVSIWDNRIKHKHAKSTMRNKYLEN